jgi:two-component system probable response regulator PhcQ
MEHFLNYQKCTILYVDDEEKSLKYFTQAFRNRFRVLSAASTTDGYRLLEQHRDEIALLMTDQRMPGEKGVEFLQRARRLHPTAIRILTTAYSDLSVAIEALNSGAIYKYVTKPWDVPQLEATLKRACELFMVQRERDLLLKEKLSALQKMIADRVLNAGILATRMGHQVRNSLVTVQTFLDLLPEKLLEEKIDVEQLRNTNFWKDFYEQTRAQIRRITELLTDLVVATEKSDFPVLREARLDETVARSVKIKRQFVAKEHHRRQSNPARASGLGGGARKVPTSFRPATEGRDHQVACRKSDFHERTSWFREKARTGN